MGQQIMWYLNHHLIHQESRASGDTDYIFQDFLVVFVASEGSYLVQFKNNFQWRRVFLADSKPKKPIALQKSQLPSKAITRPMFNVRIWTTLKHPNISHNRLLPIRRKRQSNAIPCAWIHFMFLCVRRLNGASTSWLGRWSFMKGIGWTIVYSSLYVVDWAWLWWSLQ